MECPLDTREKRNAWEKTFDVAYIQPVLQVRVVNAVIVSYILIVRISYISLNKYSELVNTMNR